jgi:hypothetical protein
MTKAHRRVCKPCDSTVATRRAPLSRQKPWLESHGYHQASLRDAAGASAHRAAKARAYTCAPARDPGALARRDAAQPGWPHQKRNLRCGLPACSGDGKTGRLNRCVAAPARVIILGNHWTCPALGLIIQKAPGVKSTSRTFGAARVPCG